MSLFYQQLHNNKTYSFDYKTRHRTTSGGVSGKWKMAYLQAVVKTWKTFFIIPETNPGHVQWHKSSSGVWHWHRSLIILTSSTLHLIPFQKSCTHNVSPLMGWEVEESRRGALTGIRAAKCQMVSSCYAAFYRKNGLCSICFKFWGKDWIKINEINRWVFFSTSRVFFSFSVSI